MKKNLPITNKEQPIAEGANILSTTNLKGAITYVNDEFIKISGFTEDELINQNHNIVRHPEMPPEAFENLWSTVKSGYPWMGMVKNRCKNGDHYWVDAFVTPIKDGDTIHEYQSVRSKAQPEYIRRAEKAYQQLLAGKKPKAMKRSTPLRLRLLYMTLFGGLPIVAYWLLQGLLPTVALPAAIALGLAIQAIGGWWVISPVCRAIARSRAEYDSPLMTWIYTGRRDEAGQIKLALKMLRSESNAIIGRLSDASQGLTDIGHELDNSVALTRTCVRHQDQEASSISAAIHEMSTTIQDMASNAHNASSKAQDGVQHAMKGSDIIEATIMRIRDLADDVTNINQGLQKLAQESQNIGSILDVIRDIAEQTNLLALNAAIEAARAGEQGRGFAVVADEVRTLANRTHESTQEIQHMLEKFQGEIRDAATMMEAGVKHADETSGKASEADEALSEIALTIDTMSDINTQIASATEEEGAVVEEISRNMSSLKEVSDLAAESMNSTSFIAGQLIETNKRLQQLALQFRHFD